MQTKTIWDHIHSMNCFHKTYLKECCHAECFYSPKMQVEILTPKVMVLGDGAFGRCLSLEGGALWNEINALQKMPERTLAL